MDKQEKIYKEAIDSFKSNNYDNSSKLLMQYLDYNSKDHIAYNLLGLSFYSLKKGNLAIKNFNKAIDLSPNNTDYLLNLSKTYIQINEKEKAKNILNKAINLNSKELKLYRELASIFYSENDFENALSIYMKIISLSPNEHQAYNNCGLIFTKLGDFNNAYRYIDKAIELNKEEASYYFNMSFSISKECDIFFTKKHTPTSYENYLELSSNFLSRVDTAITYLLKATKLNPNNADYHNELGKTYLLKNFDKKDVENALICFKNAIFLKNNQAHYYSNLAFAYNEFGLYEDASDVYKKVKDVKSSIIGRNCAYFLIKETDCKEHIDFLEEHRNYDIHLSKSLVPKIKNIYKNAKILTSKDSIQGKTIYIVKDEAIGDELQFIRYLKILKEKEAYVKLFCSKLLISVFETYKYCDEIIDSFDNAGDFDYFLPLLSVPSIVNNHSYRTEYSDIFPYLSTPKSKKEKWNIFFEKFKRKKIAFTWKSNFPSVTFYKRSSEFKFFYALARSFPDVDFFAIQKGFFEAEFHNKDNLNNIFDLSGQVEDFSDSAGILENIDLLISIDSAIVHLAGAMNLPVTMLLPYSSDWRWGLSGDKTFWYPSMDIIRQTEIGNWKTVFDQVENKLKHFT
jgi:Flp pilus assembly protein TadD